MNKSTRTILLAVLIPLITGCFSSRTSTFYLLSAMPPDRPDLGPFPDVTIYLKPVKFPEYLDRPQMVLREGDYKLQFSEYHRWAEPLKDNFTHVLMQNLNRRIVPGRVMSFSKAVKIVPDYHLSIEVLRMDILDSNQVVLSVNWNLQPEREGSDLIIYNDEFSVPVEEDGFESAVDAQSKAVALFSDQVAGVLLNMH
mgnify:CR=1 FL=1